METLQASTSPEPQYKVTKWLASLTIADGVVGLILVVAAIIRLFHLGKIPLAEDEAELAWAVWRFWQPEVASTTISSPAYFSLTAILTQLLGYNDVVMRLVPAIVGTAVVFLPWLLRQRLGTMGALIASALLAVSPLNVIISRTVSGDSLAIMAILLLVVAFFRYQETADRRWFYTLFAALGIGLSSSTLFYSALLTLLVAWGIQSVIGHPLFGHEEEVLIQPERAWWRTAVFVGLGLLVVVSTLFLWHPAGLGATTRLVADWLTQFSLQAERRAALDPLVAIGRYEGVLLLIGLLAIIQAISRNRSFALFCMYWLCAIVILTLVQQGQITNAALFTLPGVLLTGDFANGILAQKRSLYTWGTATGLMAVFLIILANAARYSRVMTTDPSDVQSLVVILAAVTLSFLTVYFISTWEVTAVYQGTLLAVLAFFIYFNWGTSWWMGQEAANDPRERWVTVGTDDDIHLLAQMITDVSRQVSNSDSELDILSSINTPILRWYLREYRQLEVSDTLPVTPDNEVIISPVNITDEVLEANYIGADFGLAHLEATSETTRVQGEETFFTRIFTPILDTFRWWLFHESTAVSRNVRVIVWVRADLIQAQ